MLYFPLDNSYENFVKTNLLQFVNPYFIEKDLHEFSGMVADDADVFKSTFNFLIYTLGAPQSSPCFKFDIYCNFECLPNPKFMNYLPLTMCPFSISSNEKREIIRFCQEKPISKADYSDGFLFDEISWLKKLKKRFGKYLPGINRMYKMGLLPYKNMVSLNNSMFID